MCLFIYGCAGSSLVFGLFCSCGERGLFFVAVRGLFIGVIALIAEPGSWALGLSSCSSRALEHRLNSCDSVTLRLVWASRIRDWPVSPALAGRLFGTEPSGKSSLWFWFAFPWCFWCWVPSHKPAGYCMSSVKRYLFKCSVHFVTGLSVFLILSFTSSLCILDTNAL